MTTPSDAVLARCQVAVEHGYYVLGDSTEIVDDATPGIGAVTAGPGVMVPVDDSVLAVQVELVLDPGVTQRPHWIAEFDQDASLTSWEGAPGVPESTAVLGAGRWAIEQEVLPPPDDDTARHILRVAPLDDRASRWLQDQAPGSSLARLPDEREAYHGGVVQNLSGDYMLTLAPTFDNSLQPSARTGGVQISRGSTAIAIEHANPAEWWLSVSESAAPSGDKWVEVIGVDIPAGAPLRALTSQRGVVPGLPDPLLTGPARLVVFLHSELDETGKPWRYPPERPMRCESTSFAGMASLKRRQSGM